MSAAQSLPTDPTTQLVETIIAEGPIGMGPAARLLGTFQGGRACHPGTVTRWAVAGIRHSGAVLKLEAVRVGGRLVTSRAAVVRFLAAQQGDVKVATLVSESPSLRSPSIRQASSERAAAQLEAQGA